LLRRVPRQERGRERVEKILNAAALLIAEVGVAAATTNAIAARARTSVGSLYQFFPNKDMIVAALAARYNDELRQLNERALPSDAAFASLEELVEYVVTPILQFHEDCPAYRHIYHATNGPEGTADRKPELHDAVVARLESVLQIRAPQLSADARHLHATVAVLTVHALLDFAMTASPMTRDGIVHELKRLMVSYLETVIDDHDDRSTVTQHATHSADLMQSASSVTASS